MGQQTKFETLDTLAAGIARAAGGLLDGPPVARLAILGEERLPRIELTLSTDGGTRELHLYEAYWAPLTEGAVTLRDVLYLLFRAVYDGVRNGTTEFRRWLFGQYQQFPPQVRTVALLVIGLVALLSLIVINAAVGLVAATRLAAGIGESIVSDGLYGDLTTLFNVLFVVVAAFAIALYLNRSAGRARAPAMLRTVAGVLSLFSLVVVVATTIAIGLAVVMLFYLHHTAGPAHTLPLLPAAFGLANVEWFDDRVAIFVPTLAIILFGAMLVELVIRVLVAARRSFQAGETHKPFTVIVLVSAGVMTLGLLAEALSLGLTDWGFAVTGDSVLERGSVWGLLVVASFFIRHILVQYVGDLTAYVQSHTVDRFDELRTKIKDRVYGQALAIYSCRNTSGELEYSDVAMIGHSLGSVIAYDTLNRLINDDLAGKPGRRLDVVERTCLLLTVGSPLDKTAYLFGVQREPTNGRDALAATIQPLIQHPAYRPARWINIHSRWDPISGAIEFYDPLPGRGDPDRNVVNLIDPDATTLFVAHLEYWRGPLLYQTLLSALPWRATHARREPPAASCPHPGLPAARGTTGLKGSLS
jgi:hypothetical protein